MPRFLRKLTSGHYYIRYWRYNSFANFVKVCFIAFTLIFLLVSIELYIPAESRLISNTYHQVLKYLIFILFQLFRWKSDEIQNISNDKVSSIIS